METYANNGNVSSTQTLVTEAILNDHVTAAYSILGNEFLPETRRPGNNNDIASTIILYARERLDEVSEDDLLFFRSAPIGLKDKLASAFSINNLVVFHPDQPMFIQVSGYTLPTERRLVAPTVNVVVKNGGVFTRWSVSTRRNTSYSMVTVGDFYPTSTRSLDEVAHTYPPYKLERVIRPKISKAYLDTFLNSPRNR
jgi:hypothetical protein